MRSDPQIRWKRPTLQPGEGDWNGRLCLRICLVNGVSMLLAIITPEGQTNKDLITYMSKEQSSDGYYPLNLSAEILKPPTVGNI